MTGRQGEQKVGKHYSEAMCCLLYLFTCVFHDILFLFNLFLGELVTHHYTSVY